MVTIPSGRGAKRWRLILLVLVILPFLPELAIRAVVGLASVAGCSPADAAPCTIGPVALGGLLRSSIAAAVATAMLLGFGGIVVWLIAIFVAVHRGFATTAVRLVLAFVLTVVFVYLPYLAPALAIADLMHADCRPHDLGVGACRLFGTAMGKASNDTQVVQWFTFLAGPVALILFAVYAFIAATRPAARAGVAAASGRPGA